MIEKDILNVVFSSDDNYAQHLGVAIYSLLKNNQKFLKIQIFIIDNQISKENRKKLVEIQNSFSNAMIYWIDFKNWKEKLKLNMIWKISLSTYARIFIASMISKEVEKIIYLDCDMIVCESLEELWNEDLQGMVLGAVQDTISDSTKIAIGKEVNQPYFNAGLLLIDLKEWREQNIEKRCLEFLAAHNGSVVHHDQGILNGVLNEKWLRLPLTFNVMTIHYMFNFRKIQKFYCDHSEFYSREEIVDAVKAPKILHFTPSFTSRPWVKGCKHPLKKMYWNIIELTPWKDAREQKDKDKFYVKIINWRYRKLPF